MTKEGIAKKYVPCRCDEAYTSRNLTAPDCPFHSTDPEVAMEEWAKQQAIAFDVWKRENCITYDYENSAYSKLIFLDVEHTKVRTEQLSIDVTYNQFIEQQTKE